MMAEHASIRHIGENVNNEANLEPKQSGQLLIATEIVINAAGIKVDDIEDGFKKQLDNVIALE